MLATAGESDSAHRTPRHQLSDERKLIGRNRVSMLPAEVEVVKEYVLADKYVYSLDRFDMSIVFTASISPLAVAWFGLVV